MLAIAERVHRAFTLRGGESKDPVRNLDITSFSLRLFKITAVFLLISVALTTANQAFGDRIICQANSHVDKKLMETKCWIDGLYTVALEENSTVIDGHEHGYVDKSVGNGIRPYHDQHKDHLKKRKHTYYQWIWLVLLLQSVLTSTPYGLWKKLESNSVRSILSQNPFGALNIRTSTELATLFERQAFKFQKLMFKMIFCMVAGLGVIIFQMHLVDKLLGGEGFYWRFGTAIANLETLFQSSTSSVEVVNPLTFVFPRMAKCDFDIFTQIGDTQTLEGLCLLPLNVINEKIYAIFWFVLWGVFTYTLLALFGYVIAYAVPTIRGMALRFVSPSDDLDHSMLTLLVHLTFSQWFVLCMMAKNMTADEFINFMEALKDLKDQQFHRFTPKNKQRIQELEKQANNDKQNMYEMEKTNNTAATMV